MFMIAEDQDYAELTHSYMSVFDSQTFYHFLNTTQTGFAHSSAGTELSLLIKGVGTALMICTIQFVIFCLLRDVIRPLFQPRSYCVPTEERMEPLPSGIFSWIIPTLRYQVHYYLALGLDAYFFIRFINILLLFFVVTGTLNMVILLPINFTGSDRTYSATGMDKLSLSNISDSNVHRLNAHLLMALVTIGLFHWLIIFELESFIKIKQRYLSTSKHRKSIPSTVVIIKEVPPPLLDLDEIQDLFKHIPGGIHSVWFVNDYKETERLRQLSEIILDKLESAEMEFLRNSHVNSKDPRPKCYPPLRIGGFVSFIDKEIGFQLPSFLRSLILEPRVDEIDWYCRRLVQVKDQLERQKVLLAENKLARSCSIIIRFNSQIGAHIVSQCLLSQKQGFMEATLTEVHPNDINWNNIVKDMPMAQLIRGYLVTLLFLLLSFLYIIPVSFIGLVSQVPLITQLLPFLNWIYGLPEELRDAVSSLLPSAALSLLTDIAGSFFRFLIHYKGRLTGAEIEMDYQRWHFAFLFIQQFIVVTVASSITVILKQIVDQPTSIPVMLATNLPKAATFFYHYIAVRALTFCGSNFLRIYKLLKYITLYQIIDDTPRKQFRRMTTLPKVKWGAVYPVFSVYASIGLAYCIISPLISLFIVFILALALLYYKYSLRFIYSHINDSDTNGRLYPTALLHLYAGVYCLEGCLMGIFLLAQNQEGKFCMRVQGLLMCVVLLATIFCNNTIYKRYSRYFTELPILSDKPLVDEASSNLSPNLSANIKMLYLHPSFKYEIPCIWIPKDDKGISTSEAERLRQHGVEASVTSGASIRFSRFLHRSRIKITNAPPGYK